MPEVKFSTNADEIGYSVKTIRQIRTIVRRWGRDHFQHYPWRYPVHLWHGLIAEILLQRTKAKNVVPVYETLIRTFVTPADLGNASVEHIESIIYPLGLKWRARLIKQLGESLSRVSGTPPDTLKDLLELPAVGPYAAAAYLSFHARKRGTIIDANVVRWLCRLVDRPMDGETRREKWLIALADSFTPQRNTREYNYALLDFTMLICTTRPKCEECPLGARYCAFRRRTLSHEE